MYAGQIVEVAPAASSLPRRATPRRNAGAGGRVGLRQDHHRQGHRAVAAHISPQIEGKALLDGRNLFELQGDELRSARRQVQIIFQDPFASLNPRMRVSEVLEKAWPLQPDLDGTAQRRQRIERW
jgi:ABC-type microcin C transport system duplicated ATPase subunit YejF